MKTHHQEPLSGLAMGIVYADLPVTEFFSLAGWDT